MVWNVYCEDFNHSTINKYNIFDHSGFAQDVKNMLESDIPKNEFTEQLNRSLRYWFWGKTEYEAVIIGLTPNIKNITINGVATHIRLTSPLILVKR